MVKHCPRIVLKLFYAPGTTSDHKKRITERCCVVVLNSFVTMFTSQSELDLPQDKGAIYRLTSAECRTANLQTYIYFLTYPRIRSVYSIINWGLRLCYPRLQLFVSTLPGGLGKAVFAPHYFPSRLLSIKHFYFIWHFILNIYDIVYHRRTPWFIIL